MKLIILILFAALVIMWGISLATGTYYEAYPNKPWLSDYNTEHDLIMMLIIGFLLGVLPLILIFYDKERK